MGLFKRKPKPPKTYVLFHTPSGLWIEEGLVLEETEKRYKVQYQDLETMTTAGRHIYSTHETWVDKNDALAVFTRPAEIAFTNYRVLVTLAGERIEGVTVDAADEYVKVKTHQLVATNTRTGKQYYTTEYVWLAANEVEAL